MMTDKLFNIIDTNGDGRVTSEELQAMFQRAAKGKGYLTVEDLREVMTFSSAQKVPVRLESLFKAETGSFFEGPCIDQLAPDFMLKTQDGKQTISLSQFRGKKPVALVLGNYT
jgi:hypothetical protein